MIGGEIEDLKAAVNAAYVKMVFWQSCVL